MNALVKHLEPEVQLDMVLTDGSGSMQDTWFNTQTALEIYFDDLKKINTHVRVATFDSQNHNWIQRDCHSSELEPLKSSPLQANFTSTPLYDAIQQMCWQLRDLNPKRCTILIVTDGWENSSKFTSLAQVKAFLTWCKTRGWAVVFMGDGFNTSAMAQELGLAKDQTIGVQKALLPEAMKMLGKKRQAYAYGADSMVFTEDEQTQYGGLLTDETR